MSDTPKDPSAASGTPQDSHAALRELLDTPLEQMGPCVVLYAKRLPGTDTVRALTYVDGTAPDVARLLYHFFADLFTDSPEMSTPILTAFEGAMMEAARRASGRTVIRPH